MTSPALPTQPTVAAVAPVTVMLRLRLSVMMFLQYFMFGAWLVTLGTYMSKSLQFDAHIGTAYGMQGLATIASTLLVGALADRLMPAQWLLSVLSVLSALSLWLVSRVTESPEAFLAAVALHFLCFVPTIPLATSIALHALQGRTQLFPGIRVWGTVGWIVAGLVVGMIEGAGLGRLPLLLGAAAGVVLGLYALSLPPVPPSVRSGPLRLSDLLGLPMLRQLRDREFAVFVAGVMVILLPLGFYNTYTNTFLVEVGAQVQVLGRALEPAAIQALGQVSEVVFLLVLPWFLLRLQVKGVLLLGMFAWALRYACFALAAGGGDQAFVLLVTGVLLHGICYDFFFVAGQIYVEAKFGPALRVRAQALLVFINMGVGVVVASNLANLIYAAHTRADGSHDWQGIWTIPGLVALLAGLGFALLFRARPPSGVA